MSKTRERAGYDVAKVVIEPAKFLEWCRVSGRKIDGETRTMYAVSLFDERSKN